jgi:serine/threonine-protein kinase/endoribonuclease IRE1
LESGGNEVCGEDWRNKIDPEVAQDLKKYRSYKPDSVRDLLRAIRNKVH